MNALRLAKPPVKLRGHRLGQHFYNLARRAQGIYREIVNQREAEEPAKRNAGNGCRQKTGCARAESGHAAAPPSVAKNFRRRM
jgi:hypothetical protein